ncbi:hypothetical protein GCM10022207_67250 [Streptomyces lannensis]|uniref:Uncharacterized protein n=1 Tax=Streptomyces lannensis TaxID=766498 RepID=A0ABP7L0E1_9ACTN
MPGGFAAAGVTNARRAPTSVKTAARARLLQAARAGRKPDPEQARPVRMVEYQVEDRGNATDRELFCLLTTLTDPLTHPAPLLAYTYAERRDEFLVQGERETDSEHLVNCGTRPGVARAA